MNEPRHRTHSEGWVRAAVICALIGLIFVFLFLWSGFQPWSVGFGVFVGLPLLLVGMILYLVSVVRDLRRRDVL